MACVWFVGFFFFFQAEDGIRDLVRSRGLGDVYKRQPRTFERRVAWLAKEGVNTEFLPYTLLVIGDARNICLLYTSDAADERSSVDLGGRRTIKKKKNI